jgi:signal transduction histidine kinase
MFAPWSINVSSIRARLTLAYAGALIATVMAFALALWALRRASATEELGRVVYAQANLVRGIIHQAENVGEPVAVVKDSLVGPTISGPVGTLLEGMPGYVMVFNESGRMLYGSAPVRRLEDSDKAALREAALNAPVGGLGQEFRLGRDRLLLVAVTAADSGSAVSRIVTASSMYSAELAVRELVGTMLVVVPILLIASIAVAYFISGNAFAPLDRLMNEMEAITDGRSLHRRLPVGTSNDEISRLAATLNEMFQRLEVSFSALRRFTADASHELKTPLAVLRADVERAMSSATSRSDRMVALEEALQETARMADLVESLLTLARADEGRFDLHREPVPLEPLVRDVFETASILGESAGLTVTMEEPVKVSVLGDITRLRQLFLNLTTNAIKYTPRGGSVEISLTQRDQRVTFSVRDTGIGISSADLPHIFERFYRADRVRTRVHERGGFGLGLAIGQWIAEAHGGTITAASRLGRGTTFTVTIPILDGNATSSPPAPQAAAPLATH